MLDQSLKGIRVLDFTRLYPGPLCTLMLSDLGADVIKVERPDGEMGRLMKTAFQQLNRSKRSLTLDLEKEHARKIVRNILKGCDVVVESFRPDVMQRFLLDYESLREEFPQLVYCSITGYGQTGAQAQSPGHDLNYISVAGIISENRAPGKTYVIPPVQIADTLGAFQGMTAILAALFQRHQTGMGQFLDISLLDGAFMAMILLASTAIGHEATESKPYLSGRLACYNIYRTSDDRYLAMALLEPKFWKIFCSKIELPQLENLQFQEDQSRLIQTVAERIAIHSLQWWLDFFEREDVCMTPVQSVEEALRSDYANQQRVFMKADHAAGPMFQIKTPFVHSVRLNAAPALGEHSHQILKEAGYSDEQIEVFIREKVI